jgi:hypothetical protein
MKFEVLSLFFEVNFGSHYFMVVNAYKMILRKPKGQAALRT